MDFILKKKLDSRLYKTLHKVYSANYDNIGQLTNDEFNEFIVVLVKSGLIQTEIRELLERSIDGEENEFKKFIRDNQHVEHSMLTIVLLMMFGMIFTFFLIRLLYHSELLVMKKLSFVHFF